MTEPTDKTRASRRRFLAGAAGLRRRRRERARRARRQCQEPAAQCRRTGRAISATASACAPTAIRRNSKRTSIRRTVPWLTATPESSVSFTPLHELDGIITPNGLCFERHHAGIAEVDPNDYRLMIHGLVDKPLIFTLDDLKRLPRVNRIHFLECAANSGMEWRGAQLNGCQYTHGMVHCVQYTGVPLKLLLEQAGVKAERQMDPGRRRRRRGDEPLDPARQGARRLPRRLSHERRDAAARAGLSGAPRRAGLGRQCLGEVAAPHQGRRPALVHARGDLEIHRPDGRTARRASSPS